MNRQPWHFIVVESRDTLRQLGALAKLGPLDDVGSEGFPFSPLRD
jgi:nitroreductase